jgi:hypothetical protein
VHVNDLQVPRILQVFLGNLFPGMEKLRCENHDELLVILQPRQRRLRVGNQGLQEHVGGPQAARPRLPDEGCQIASIFRLGERQQRGIQRGSPFPLRMLEEV